MKQNWSTLAPGNLVLYHRGTFTRVWMVLEHWSSYGKTKVLIVWDQDPALVGFVHAENNLSMAALSDPRVVVAVLD